MLASVVGWSPSARALVHQRARARVDFVLAHVGGLDVHSACGAEVGLLCHLALREAGAPGQGLSGDGGGSGGNPGPSPGSSSAAALPHGEMLAELVAAATPAARHSEAVASGVADPLLAALAHACSASPTLRDTVLGHGRGVGG